MKRTFLFYIVMFCLITSINGQKDYREGYVIKSEGDTLFGMIDYRRDMTNSKKCTFLSDKNETFEFSAEDIIAFRYINDKFYIAKKAKLYEEIETRFMEYLIDGVADIYAFHDINGIRYFVEKDTSGLVELKEIKQEVYVDNIKYQSVRKEYIGNLKILFNDAPNIYDKIEKSSLSRRSLVNIGEAYHNEVCDEYQCINYTKSLPKFSISLGLIGGMQLYSVRPYPTYINSYEYETTWTFNGEYEDYLTPMGGFYFTIPIPYTYDRLSFHYEGYLSQRDFRSNYTIYNIYTVYGDANNPYSMKYISYQNLFLFRYNILSWKLRPLVQFGANLNANFNCKFQGLENVLNPFSLRETYGLCYGMGLSYKINDKYDIGLYFLGIRGSNLMQIYDFDNYTVYLEIPVYTFIKE